MKHEVLVASTATLVERAADLVVCDLADSPPGPLALGLALLDRQLVDELVLRPERGPWVLRIRASQAAREIRLHRYGDRRLELGLGDIARKLLLAYFLRYYRDGQPEVDHLDLEAEWSTGGACDVTVKTAVAPPPGR